MKRSLIALPTVGTRELSKDAPGSIEHEVLTSCNARLSLWLKWWDHRGDGIVTGGWSTYKKRITLTVIRAGIDEAATLAGAR
jgi:hypothetical protein